MQFAHGVWWAVFVNSIKSCISKINTLSSIPSLKLTLARWLNVLCICGLIINNYVDFWYEPTDVNKAIIDDVWMQASSFVRWKNIDSNLNTRRQLRGSSTFRRLWKRRLSGEDERLKRTIQIVMTTTATGKMIRDCFPAVHYLLIFSSY